MFLAYAESEGTSVVDFYRAWAALLDATETHGSEIAEFQAIWSIRWDAPGVVVRVTQCLDPSTREFTLVCAAIEEFG